MRKLHLVLLFGLVACGGGGGNEPEQREEACNGKVLFTTWRNQAGKTFDFTGCQFSRPCLVDVDGSGSCNNAAEEFSISFQVDDSFTIQNCGGNTTDSGMYSLSNDCTLSIDYDDPSAQTELLR